MLQRAITDAKVNPAIGYHTEQLLKEGYTVVPFESFAQGERVGGDIRRTIANALEEFDTFSTFIPRIQSTPPQLDAAFRYHRYPNLRTFSWNGSIFEELLRMEGHYIAQYGSFIAGRCSNLFGIAESFGREFLLALAHKKVIAGIPKASSVSALMFHQTVQDVGPRMYGKGFITLYLGMREGYLSRLTHHGKYGYSVMVPEGYVLVCFGQQSRQMANTRVPVILHQLNTTTTIAHALYLQ